MQIFKFYRLLVVAGALLDVLDKMSGVCTEINHQVGHLHLLHHQSEKFHVRVEVKVRYYALFVVVLGKDIDTLED